MAQVNVRNRPRKDGSNNWEYRFEIAKIGEKRKRISKSGFKTKKEALDEGIKAYEEYINGGQVIKPSEISVSDYIDQYINTYGKDNLEQETIRSYTKIARLYIKPKIGHYKLKTLSPLIISQLFSEMKNDGFSRSSLVKVHTVLSGALLYAVHPLKYIKESPMLYYKLPKESKKQTQQTSAGGVRSDGKKNGAIRGNNKHIYISKDWIDKIFERFPQGHPDHIPLKTGYMLGTRIGEAYALTVEDFDFENNSVTIDKQVQWNPDTQHWYFKSPKYDSVRTISIPDDYAELIKAKIKQSQKDRNYYEEHYTRYYLNNDDEIVTEPSDREIHLINVREDGTYIAPRTMQHCSSVIHHTMGFTEFDYHSLRHTHATDLAKAGASPKYAQYRLGHKTMKVTLEIYQHVDEEMERIQSEILNDLYK